MTRIPTPVPHVAPQGRGWSEADVLQLRTLWGQPGLSAARIAERLGFSRNAVLGKAHRLGLCKPRAPRAARPPRRPRPMRQARPARRASPPPPPLDEVPPLVPRLEALAARACHWPIGDPQAEGFGFCGRGASRTYCDLHWARAHRGA